MNPVQAAERAIREGSVDEALQLLQSAVRASPGDAALRIFLFQLLAVQGQWERSLNQLNVAAELDAKLARLGWERKTEKTFLNPDEFKRHLLEVRERGWAFDDEEDITTLRCIAAPIRTAEHCNDDAAVDVHHRGRHVYFAVCRHNRAFRPGED